MNGVMENAVVDRVFVNRTIKGKTYHVLQLRDGNRVFCFDTKEVEGVQEGDSVTLAVEKKGDYLHLVKLHSNNQGSSNNSNKWDRERESIERQSAVRTVATLLQHRECSKDEFTEWTQEILRLIKGGNGDAS